MKLRSGTDTVIKPTERSDEVTEWMFSSTDATLNDEQITYHQVCRMISCDGKVLLEWFDNDKKRRWWFESQHGLLIAHVLAMAVIDYHGISPDLI